MRSRAWPVYRSDGATHSGSRFSGAFLTLPSAISPLVRMLTDLYSPVSLSRVSLVTRTAATLRSASMASADSRMPVRFSVAISRVHGEAGCRRTKSSKWTWEVLIESVQAFERNGILRH